MQSYRDALPPTQNGYTNVINPNTNPDSSFSSPLQKFSGFRDNMAITTDMYVNQTRHNLVPSQFGHTLSYQHNSIPAGLHNLSNSADCHAYNGFSSNSRVYEVWTNNFYEGVRIMRKLVRFAKYVAVDTEFPGIVARVYGEFTDSVDLAYHNIKANTEMLRPIQIGFSFFDEKGASLEAPSTIQFNLKWNVDSDTHATESINLLQQSGIDFFKLKRDGIDQHEFAEMLVGCGLALNGDLTWLGFHSAYDFAYLMKMCTGWIRMPFNWKEFSRSLNMFFPRVIDLKTLLAHHGIYKGGLQEVADNLRVKRCGSKHQAGSDSMLTGEAFFRFLETSSEGVNVGEILNLIYGFNFSPTGPGNHCSQLNGSLLDYGQHKGDAIEDPSSPGKKTHSAGQSGRSSPEGSLSGHKSS